MSARGSLELFTERALPAGGAEVVASGRAAGGELAATFVGWGIPTAESILNVKKAVPDMTVFASGGIKDGLDIAKCIALGATLGGMAGQFLKAAAISTKSAVQMMNLTKRQIEVTMFAAGVQKITELEARQLLERS